MKAYSKKNILMFIFTFSVSTLAFAASNPASTTYVNQVVQEAIAQLSPSTTYTAGAGILIDTATNPATISATANNHAIGDTYQGGTIFYLDSASSGQHGLIASVSDNSSAVRYSDSGDELAVGDGLLAGISNTNAIRSYQASQGDTADSAALTCLRYAIQADGATACDQTTSAAAGANCYADWYLPSKFELIQLALQDSVVRLTDLSEYWSSTQVDASSAYAIFVESGFSPSSASFTKGDALTVRCIRAF
ncbi:MAG: hypothetical protein P1U36_03760 [Legionellaceae bacterium]|nr:hypothetical protein [Legionellaceae bacterium]